MSDLGVNPTFQVSCTSEMSGPASYKRHEDDSAKNGEFWHFVSYQIRNMRGRKLTCLINVAMDQREHPLRSNVTFLSKWCSEHMEVPSISVIERPFPVDVATGTN